MKGERIRRAAIVTTVSDALRREVEATIPAARGKTRTVPNPVLPAFVASPRPFPEGRFKVLMVGTGLAKNVVRQIEALRGMDAELTLVGLPQPEAITAVASFGGEMRSDLSVEEMVEEYRRCDLVLFASIYEGYGLPIVEAQATGRPVVTSDRSGMLEVAGGAAVLVDPESVESIRAGIRRVVEDRAERERLIEAGYANAARMNVETVAELYRQTYRDAYGDSNGDLNGGRA